MCSRTLPAQTQGQRPPFPAQLQSQGSYLGMPRWQHLFICIINEAEAAGLLGNPTQSSSDEMAHGTEGSSLLRGSLELCRLVTPRFGATGELFSHFH